MGLRNWVGSVIGSGDASPLTELDRVAAKAQSLSLSVTLEPPSGEPIRIDVRKSGGPWVWAVAQSRTGRSAMHHARSFAQVITLVAGDVKSRRRLDLDSVSSRSAESPVRGTALTDLCIAALCEAFGDPVPSPEDLVKRREAAKAAAREKGAKSRAKRKELLGLLDEGQDGVAEWNRRHKEATTIAPLRKVDLSGKDLARAQLVDMPEGRFENTILAGASLRGGDFRRASFTGANLEGADLSGAQLQGADFTGARLDDARWNGTHFDESTTWPEGFALPEQLHWTGKGPSPAALAAITARKKDEGPIDLGAFMKRLEATIEKARLAKALGMLKKDRFQLFVEVTDERLAGVVKSQTDPDLVYSCLLGADGRFSCCTQNLNVCGGLRGAVCKHLLVLIVGVAQAGEASPDTLDDWVQRSTLHQPALQKDAQSAVLLRYKGAEAGEIDWRPTETVPEDFYAY